jgi:hypothetical protein
MKKFALPLSIALALLVGIAIGFFAGRAMLERTWSAPITHVSASDVALASVEGADPTPATGTTILAALPLVKMRQAVLALTEKDPVQVTLTSFGNGEEGGELHLMLRNNAPCTVTSVRGVAYAYDSTGTPVKANKAGEKYIAFESAPDAKVAIAKSAKYILSQVVHHTETASLGVAHVDAYTCAEGPGWTRPSR